MFGGGRVVLFFPSALPNILSLLPFFSLLSFDLKFLLSHLFCSFFSFSGDSPRKKKKRKKEEATIPFRLKRKKGTKIKGHLNKTQAYILANLWRSRLYERERERDFFFLSWGTGGREE